MPEAPGRLFLALECAAIFVVMPLLFYPHATHFALLASLWLVAAYAVFILSRDAGFSWARLWRGRALSPREFKILALRFLVSTFGIFILARWISPQTLFAFPSQRPVFYLAVMILYPLLSALPQELVFRSFFFRRYQKLFPGRAMLFASACAFGFIHVIFHNWVSPPLSLLCGYFLAGSYDAHKSLKRASIEHALYGDMVFTIGLGYYFLLEHTVWVH